MKTKADYHIHSTYSRNNHGKSTIEEIVVRAVDIGLEKIAITDHGPSHYLYGIKRNKIKEAKSEIIKMRKKYPGIKILFGVEANILSFQGDTDINDDIIENCDIILCGYHIGATFSTFNDFKYFTLMNYLGKYNEKVRKKMIEKNTEAIVNALYKYNINILTHPGDKIPLNIDKVAQAAEKTNTLLEINNSHGHLSSEEIKIAAKYNVKFVINSDSHIKDKIGGCENGIKAAKNAGLDLSRIINLV
ncbi:PHP domain-containing protein [Sedimentibacter sp. MB31-C6]|uniref:PHP domain-containing protein n=1 Tax=Sedimentibacter sp. MB31-C6 TaxID=3109366 RepID=UPI002DDC9294|nr:PHP domain-containing protein [Sedimentibacter sp. MB36-C1]WSI03425.1 PHP domain-containing protein [Sedimentibacter sp. MB36-C1]